MFENNSKKLSEGFFSLTLFLYISTIINQTMKNQPSPQLAIDYLTACRYYPNRHYTVTKGTGQNPSTVVFHKGVPYQPHDVAVLEAYGFQVLGGVLQK